MPGAPLSLFISYSRSDSAFVDRLEADLKARGFYVWVDRRKLEGGQDWMDVLQQAIDRCHMLLVVLSPEAMASKYVRREYRYADQQGKPIIPLNWRSTKVPMDLNGLQWVDFQRSYDQGLAELLVALSRQELAESPPPRVRPTASITISEPEPILVTPQPAPPPPDVDLNELYRAGVAARAEGTLERTAIFWQQVLDRDPHFGNGTLKPQMDRLIAELRPIRVQHLREQAEQACKAGEWGKEIGAWQALLGLESNDTQAKERISLAQYHQKYAWMYENALEFAKAKNFAAVKTQLELLWQDAPYYGDPAGLAKPLGLIAQNAAVRRTIVCPRCGAQNNAGSSVCFNCGLDLPQGVGRLTVPPSFSDYRLALRGPSGLIELGSEPLTIGRSRANRLSLTNNQISGRHAEIHPLPGGRYQVVDLGSTQGTAVNGVKLSPGEPQPLNAGDVINLGGSGGIELRLEFIF